MLEANDCGKRSRLLQNGNNYGRKKIYSTNSMERSSLISSIWKQENIVAP
jgi:hypothetical protein